MLLGEANVALELDDVLAELGNDPLRRPEPLRKPAGRIRKRRIELHLAELLIGGRAVRRRLEAASRPVGAPLNQEALPLGRAAGHGDVERGVLHANLVVAPWDAPLRVVEVVGEREQWRAEPTLRDRERKLREARVAITRVYRTSLCRCTNAGGMSCFA